MVTKVKDHPYFFVIITRRLKDNLKCLVNKQPNTRLDARQDERQLPFAVTLAGRSDWHAACGMRHATMMQRCAHAHCVWLPHTWQRLTELYGNIRSSAPIFRISDFKDFKISYKISRFQERFLNRRTRFQASY